MTLLTKFLGSLLLLLLLAAPVHAQPTAADRWVSPLGSASARKAADIESWATALTATALDVKASCFDAEDRKNSCLRLGIRTGVTYGAVLGIKALVHRRRPCAPDCGIDNPDFSFYSAHTALAFQSVNFRRGSPGPRLVFSLPLALDTGKGRIAAGKHYPTDVLMGAGAGLLSSLIR